MNQGRANLFHEGPANKYLGLCCNISTLLWEREAATDDPYMNGRGHGEDTYVMPRMGGMRGGWQA